MATRRYQPLRTLLGLLIFTAVLFGAMAIWKAWSPKLGLDLRGGTTITLTARDIKGGTTVNKDSLELARGIMEKRVNGAGVSEAEVAISGDRQIIVSVPGVQQNEIVEMVGQTAQLAFRPVISEVANQEATKPKETPKPGEPVMPTALPAAPASPRPTEVKNPNMSVADALKVTATPQDTAELTKFKCGDAVHDVIDQPLITCDEDGKAKYVLGPVIVKGDMLTDASAAVPQGQVNYQVNLSLNGEGGKKFGDASTAMVSKPQPTNQFAIVLDGKVVSAPRIESAITNGNAQITGNFNQQSATKLANVLKYGSLPLAFSHDSVDNVSATLGSDQLKAGILAGLIGLGLVILYSFLYYRALGIVVVASLAVAAILTYAFLCLLGFSMGLALNLPGVAGAIVAIGVTADSFIIYFERIRDEVREGRTLRTAIEEGWRKARGTILVADFVSLLSALVLFILAIGSVKGFAFTLGLTTLIDLAIVFWFTKPLMTLLGRTRFFGEGHKWSGLDPEHMGVERINSVRSRRPRPSAAATTATTAEEA